MTSSSLIVLMILEKVYFHGMTNSCLWPHHLREGEPSITTLHAFVNTSKQYTDSLEHFDNY
jgi:hypothetical protein